MNPYYQDDRVTLYHGDCRDILAGMAAESVAAVITDPPYTERTHSNARTPERAGVSTFAAPDEMMSLAAIEHLDFEPDWHCESARHHSGRSHGGPGWALVTQSCPACAGHSTQGVICRSWWDAKCRSKARCDLCGHISTMADFVRIAAVLA